MLTNYSSTHTNTLGFVRNVRPPHLVMFMFRSLVLKFLNYYFAERKGICNFANKIKREEYGNLCNHSE
jgi:hypothetical protein